MTEDHPGEGPVKKVKIEVPDNDDVEMEGEEEEEEDGNDPVGSRMLFHQTKGSLPELIGERSRVLACVRKVRRDVAEAREKSSFLAPIFSYTLDHRW